MSQHGWFFQLPGKAWNRCQEKATGVRPFTLTAAVLFPFIHFRKLHEKFTRHCTVFSFTACMSKDSNLETILKTGGDREQVGCREGKFRPFMWDGEPTHQLLDIGGPHQGSGESSCCAAAPPPLHREKSAFFFWQTTVYLVGRQGSFICSQYKFAVEPKCVSCSLNVYF